MFWFSQHNVLIASDFLNVQDTWGLGQKNQAPLLGDLRSAHVTAATALLKMSMDYGGPYLVKIHNNRSIWYIKVFICVFIS